MKTRVLNIGAGGFLGSVLARELPRDSRLEIDSTDRASLDFLQPIASQLEKELASRNYSHAVISAAITDVEKCAKEPELSQRVNVEGTRELLLLLQAHGVKPVFFSSDLVFDGRRDLYREEDPCSPETRYGHQKLEIEDFIRQTFENHLIFRTSKQMSLGSHPRCILNQARACLSEGRILRAFTDQWITPVFVEDVAEVVRRSILGGLNGTYHLACERIFTRHELALEIARSIGADPQLVQPGCLAEMSFAEPRPHHNTIDSKRIREALGVRFREPKEALA